MGNDIIEIAGLRINNTSYSGLLSAISGSITAGRKLLISYANANTINLIHKNKNLSGLLSSFDIIHPDGAGIYAAAKFLHSKNSLTGRMTGSDFYPLLIQEAIKNKWKIFFFGHDENTLAKIPARHPGLIICGTVPGYNFDDDEVISAVNSSSPDILIIGLGFPPQEKWLARHRDKLDFRAALCVGDGIKVFAGTKTRGPAVLRKIGLEWLARLLNEPAKYFKRYVIGNPVFLYRIIKLKIRKFRG